MIIVAIVAAAWFACGLGAYIGHSMAMRREYGPEGWTVADRWESLILSLRGPVYLIEIVAEYVTQWCERKGLYDQPSKW